jgi:hypothetical protein
VNLSQYFAYFFMAVQENLSEVVSFKSYIYVSAVNEEEVA